MLHITELGRGKRSCWQSSWPSCPSGHCPAGFLEAGRRWKSRGCVPFSAGVLKQPFPTVTPSKMHFWKLHPTTKSALMSSLCPSTCSTYSPSSPSLDHHVPQPPTAPIRRHPPKSVCLNSPSSVCWHVSLVTTLSNCSRSDFSYGSCHLSEADV